MKTRNRKPKKNTKSQSQKAKKEKSKEKNGPHQKNQRTPLRNEFEPSAKNHLGEGSNKGLSAQYFRSNLHPIYQQLNGPSLWRGTGLVACLRGKGPMLLQG